MADSRRVLKEGFLKKRSRDSLIKKWQRRYFKLYANELVYCLSPSEPAVRRSLRLGHDSDVRETNDQGYAMCFVVKASPTDVNFYLQAESDAEKMEWVTAIFEAFRPLQNTAPASPSRAASTRVEPPPKRVLLHLTIQSARNLKAADLNGKSDPYCVVTLVGKNGALIRSEEVRTNYITATLHPEWKASFVIGNAVDLHSVDALHFELWDHDHIGRDDSLGVVRVPLSIFQMSPASTGHTEIVDTWFRVEPPEKAATALSSPRSTAAADKELLKNYGDLRLIMSVTGPNLVKFFQSLHLTVAPQGRIVNEGLEHSDNRLELTVLSARDLISADFNNSSDPFCECTLLDTHGKAIRGESYRTSVKHTTRNPTWENAHTVFGMVSRIDDAAKLKVRVLDWDRASKNDPLGCVEIALDAISCSNTAVSFDLQPEPGMAIREGLGSIQLKLGLFGERRGERARRLSIHSAVTEKTHEQSEEQLELENAQHDLHDAACKLDGARIACAVDDYRARDPRFYGINGCIHQLSMEIPRAHQETKATDESFQARAGLEGHAQLEVTVVEVAIAPESMRTDVLTTINPYAVLEITPAACVEACKRTSAPLSPQKSKRIEALTTAAAESRNAMLSRRVNAEVSSTRTKLAKNEMRSERFTELSADRPALRVQVLSGHGLAGVDRGGYSDPYCTLTVTDRATGKPVESEKKKTAIISRTLNPVWTDEVFLFGSNHALERSDMLLIHVKDHNNLGRSTPLGRVQIPLQDLCRASADSMSIASTALEKRYRLTPEPWMKKQAQDLGELCIRTEVVGDATVLAEMLQRAAKSSPEKLMSVMSFSSLTSDPYMHESQLHASLSSTDTTAQQRKMLEYEDEVTEVLERGREIRTATVMGSPARWRKEKFELALSYPGMFSAPADKIEHYTLHLRVHGARNLLGAQDAGIKHRSGSAGANEYEFQHHRIGRTGATNAYFTVIPVLKGSELDHSEKQQSLTVYGSRNPRWPEQEFVFGARKDIARIAYLSLHVYSRNLVGESSSSLAMLLTKSERQQEVRLQRHALYKLAPSSEVDDDGFEVLAFDQRVLAFRACESGGRFVPARVLRYVPYPQDEYVVLFENRIETIDDVRDLFSDDVLGEIKALRADGNADVVLLNQQPGSTGSADSGAADALFASNVPPALLTPVQSFADATTRTLARPIDKGASDAIRWMRLLHTVSALKVEVLSVANVQPGVRCPACFVTLLGNPSVSTSSGDKLITVMPDGRMVAKKHVRAVDWPAGEPFNVALGHGSTSTDVDDLHFLDNKVFAFGVPASDDNDNEDDNDRETTTESQLDAIDDSADILAHVASLLIRVVDQRDDVTPNANHDTIGFAKIDLASLRDGEQLLSVPLIPSVTVPYYKYVGCVNLHVTAEIVSEANISSQPTPQQPRASISSSSNDSKRNIVVCGFSEWFDRRAASLPSAMSFTAAPRGLSRIERRDVLRTSLNPTENAQVDALATVLAVVLERVVRIVREIQRFEAFEVLAPDAMRQCRDVHTTNADPSSEWLGRSIHELSVETRKDIVLHLEFELLDIAGSDAPRVHPREGHTRDEWVALRTERQKAIEAVSGFIVQDRTGTLVLLYPNCVTGDGLVSWILRAPAVLWNDEWTKYCDDPVLRNTALLRWRDPKLEQDPDAIAPPRTREQAVRWLSALSDAGYIENVTATGVGTEANRSHCVVEDRTDRFYRVREVDRWIHKQRRDKSLFPLDLVQELECQQFSSSNNAMSSSTVVPRSVSTGSVSAGAGAVAGASPGAGAGIGASAGAGAGASDGTGVGAESAVTDAVSTPKQLFAKKLTDHVGGFLGTHTRISSVLFAPERKRTDLLAPVIEKTKELLDDDVLWDWKYALFVPKARTLYVYESETSSLPSVIVDMASAACCVAYSSSGDTNIAAAKSTSHNNAWFEIAHAAIFVRSVATQSYVPINDEQRDAMLTTRRADNTAVLAFKSTATHRWVQAFALAGVRTRLYVGQKVVLKRLNAVVLHKKCIEYETEFAPLDLEGSFQRLLNRFFRHHVTTSHKEYEDKLRQLRATLRGELKKTARVGDTVLAYFGKGLRLNPKPSRPENFTKDALYSGRIVRVRSPYSDAKYGVTSLTYDRSSARDVPAAMTKLLAKYDVTDKAAWLRLPTALRDIFLLYDVEYRHANELVIDEGMLREHFRAADGDLDAIKVDDACRDANLVFRPTDLEDCVTRLALACNGRKPLGSLRIPIKNVSPHRVIDAWYPLAPESDMTQKRALGQIRVQLRLKHISQFVRSKKAPALLEDVKDIVTTAAAKRPLLAPLASAAANPLQAIKDAVTPRSKRSTALASSGGSGTYAPQERSFLKVTIHEARKLLPADFRIRNPYVKLVLLYDGAADSREENTLMKADVKPKTLNPRWVNNSFTLGKPENAHTALRDKRALVLRVLDENVMLGDTPLGYVRIDLRRDKTGALTDLVLVHADAQGNATNRALHLDATNSVDVDAMLLSDERLRQDKSAKAKDNDAAVDGRLGKLRFSLQLIPNDNFVENADSAAGAAMSSTSSSPSKVGTIAMAAKHVETTFSVELKVKRVAAVSASAAAVAKTEKLDWREFTCVFQPHGEGGQRVLYDPQSEDLVQGNRHRLSDLLHHGSKTSVAAGDSVTLDASNVAATRTVLGRTYDVAKVAYFSVQITSDALGRTFQGKFAPTEMLKHPELNPQVRDEVIVLTDKDTNEVELQLTVDVYIVAIHRAERVRRVLAETFRLVGLPFDPKTMNQHSSAGSGTPAAPSSYGAAGGSTAHAFLWEVFKVSTFPGRNVSHELLAQVRRMSHATKLHWRFTPQLLCFVYEHVFVGGMRDALTYSDAAALDAVLARWSAILTYVSDAKNQLIGHLHGRETPQLVHALFTHCDWTGFEFAAVGTSAVGSEGTNPADGQSDIVFRQGDGVHASLPLCKHAGVAVDIRLRTGAFVAGTIIREFGDDSYDVAFCTAAKVRDESDEYFSDDDELPPLALEQTVFVCPLARAGAAAGSDRDAKPNRGRRHDHALAPGRIGKVVEHDTATSPSAPYRVAYDDAQEPTHEWLARVCLDSMFTRVVGSDVHRQLVRDDFVRVLPSTDATSGSNSASRPARVLKNHGNARYRVEYLDSLVPTLDAHVSRDRLEPLVERTLYDGVIVDVYRQALATTAATTTTTVDTIATSAAATEALVVMYDVQLANGAVVERVTREHLRASADHFVTDRFILGCAFTSNLAVCDAVSSNTQSNDEVETDIAVKLDNLWESDHVVRAYLLLPHPVASVELRDAVSNKLLQTRLHERDDTKPRFVEQCHGYVCGNALAADASSLAQLHAAAAKQQRFSTSTSGLATAVTSAVNTDDPPFDINNAVCVLLAPQPRVELHGCMRVSATPASLALFKAVLALGVKRPTALSALLQQPLRSAASAKLPLNRKPRVLAIDRVDIFFDKKRATNVVVNALSATCDGDVVAEQVRGTVKRESSVALKHVHLLVHFSVAVPHNNRGSLAAALKAAYEDALLVLEVLTASRALVLADTGDYDSVPAAVAAGAGVWLLEDAVTEPHRARSLAVEMMNRDGMRGTSPTLSLELLPLDDVRLRIKDVHGAAHDVCLSAQQLLTEATLRRQLAPFRSATVLRGPVFLPADHAKQQQVRKHMSRGANAVVPPYYHVAFSDKASKKTQDDGAFVPRTDLRLDVLSVHVLQVAQMFVRDAAGATGSSASASITAEVLLVSSDFEPQRATDDALRPPHGVVLSPTGDIVVDRARTKYPDKSSVTLVRDRDSCMWTTRGGQGTTTPIEFGHPGIDLTRVRAVKVRLVDRKRSGGASVIGTVTIPLADVASVGVWTEREYAQHVEQTAAGSSTASTIAPPSAARTFSLEREEHGRAVVVGKITLALTRRHRVYERDAVEVKHCVDPWRIDAYELLVATLALHSDKLLRGLLAAGARVRSGGRAQLTDTVEKELQLQKIATVMAVATAMERIYATRVGASNSNVLEVRPSEQQLTGSNALATLKHALAQTKWIVEDTAAALGITTKGHRMPWASDARAHDGSSASRSSKPSDVVVVHANVPTATLRLRRAILKLYHMYRHRLTPTLQRLYELDAAGDALDLAAGEQLLRFFEDEVESLDDEDEAVYRRVYQRLRLLKLVQVLDAILTTTLRVKVMDQHASEHDLVGLAQIPLMDLVDQDEHCYAYSLTKPNRGFNNSALRVENLIDLGLHAATSAGAAVRPQGKVVLRLRFTYAESALLEQAISVYKALKDKYIKQHAAARQRINAAVVPAQHKRWARLQSYLNELTIQADGKLDWHRTPLLLNLVWDIFASHKPATPSKTGTAAAASGIDDSVAIPGFADKIDAYRAAVVHVHTRWANVQPLFDELLAVRAAPQLHAQRTVELLDIIHREVDGLDVVLATAWQQVNNKWLELLAALTELVAMTQKNRIHLGRAPQLLKLVLDKCSRGLRAEHADAVANVQFRWMAITQPDGPLAELRLMEKTGLHWRRTHELVLLLREQCEGFADVDAHALDVVEGRWTQVQEWLEDIVGMHQNHQIDCEATPFILKKIHLLAARGGRDGDTSSSGSRSSGSTRPGARQHDRQSTSSPTKGTSPSKSSRSLGKSGPRLAGASPPASPPLSPTAKTGESSSSTSAVVDTGEVDAGRLEGLAEWYALEEAKYELERIPFHRITTDAERASTAQYVRDGRDSRLLITQQEMALTPATVRAALEDRGVIPKFSSFVVGSTTMSTGADAPPSSPSRHDHSSGAAAAVSNLPTDLLDEIAELELAVETMHDSAVRPQVLANPERFAELAGVIDSLGKTDLLWKIAHAVNASRELDVPTNFARLLEAMALRQIPTGEIENLARTLTVVLQKEELRAAGIDVAPTANFTDVLSLMHAHQVKDVSLPQNVDAIQALLHDRGMDRRGEPVFLRGMRIGTQSATADDAARSTATGSSVGAIPSTLNMGLGLIDTHVELLRKALLLEALRKRNSVIKTFPAETHVLSDHDLRAISEVDMSGDYSTLIERFQQLLIHESYMKRLASYAALDRCMRALVGAGRDDVVTKEDIAIALQRVDGGHRYRLPLEAFTRDELLEAARAGKIRTPTDDMLEQCPRALNARAMAHYAAVSYAAMVFQETTSFSSRVDPVTHAFQDALPVDAKSSVDGVVIPKDRSRLTLKAYVIDWLLGTEDAAMHVDHELGEQHRQRLLWASAAFTLRHRWYQRGYGWCDDASKGVGVKVLLDRLLVFAAANKMHMVATDALLREVTAKCTNMRARDRTAMDALAHRYAINAAMLATLVTDAEKCANNRKLHSEETPALLHALEQACVVPQGLSAIHQEAYHVVTSHWRTHRARLDELVQMHKEGTFSIHRTPELLGAMEVHTEGRAGATELDEASVYAYAAESSDSSKIDEIRRGQRKAPSSLHLDLGDPEAVQRAADAAAAPQDWKSLSPSKRVVQALSPREKQTSWKVVTSPSAKQSVVLESRGAATSAGGGAASGGSSPRRRSSLGDDLKELLKSPTKWLLEPTAPVERIRPELFFPVAVAHDSSFVATAPTPAPTQ